MPTGAVRRSDAALLAATLRGDESAFLEIYRRHHGRLYRFAYRMTGSAAVAGDITHSCFASLLESPGRYDGRRSSLGTYLCAAARHQSLRAVRLARREPSNRGAPDLRASQERDPLQRLLDDERAVAVRRAVIALAPLHREVLILVEYEELDLATVAEIVGADVGAVKVRLHRARKKLRAALEAYMCGDPEQGR